MDKPKIDGSSRRRRMLPQRANSKPGSMRLASLSEQENVNIPQPSSTLQAPHFSTTTKSQQIEARSMPPPPSLGRSRSTREPSNTGTTKLQSIASTTRRPSAARPSTQAAQESLVTPARARTSSVGLNAPTTGKASFHGRSVSHQVPKTAVSDTSSTRTSSRGSNIQASSRASLHGRSVNQQVPKTVVPGTSSLRTPLPRQSSLRSQKPAFSTLQQHFTPKKPAKRQEPTPTSQSESKDEIPSADIFRLQMELTQLHLLHRSASTTQTQWEQSAKKHFQHQFTALCERHVELKEIAQQQQTLINQLASVQWSHGKTGPQIVEKVQILSRNITEICNLLDTEGKYTRILEIFKSWFAQALKIREQRESQTKGQNIGRALEFIEGIGDGWKAEAMVLERDLTYCLREVKGFGSVAGGSSLGKILELYNKLIAGLIEELDVVQWVENEIMVQETGWVERTIHNLAENVSGDIGSMVSSQRELQS